MPNFRIFLSTMINFKIHTVSRLFVGSKYCSRFLHKEFWILWYYAKHLTYTLLIKLYTLPSLKWTRRPYFVLFIYYLRVASVLCCILHFNLLDIKECAISQPCHIHASCIDTPGSYQCVCKDGFVDDGLSCVGKYSGTVTQKYIKRRIIQNLIARPRTNH